MKIVHENKFKRAVDYFKKINGKLLKSLFEKEKEAQHSKDLLINSKRNLINLTTFFKCKKCGNIVYIRGTEYANDDNNSVKKLEEKLCSDCLTSPLYVIENSMTTRVKKIITVDGNTIYEVYENEKLLNTFKAK